MSFRAHVAALAFILMLLFIAGVEQNPGPLRVKGTFHQGHPDYFEADSVGRQCVTNCVAAMVFATNLSVGNLLPAQLASVLTEGDRLYRNVRQTQSIDNPYLMLDDIPSCVEMLNRRYFLTTDRDLFGSECDIGSIFTEAFYVSSSSVPAAFGIIILGNEMTGENNEEKIASVFAIQVCLRSTRRLV